MWCNAIKSITKYYFLILFHTNPPFGKKSSVTIVNEAGDEKKPSLVVHRDDFWASTSNKQLNFLQHVFTILKQHGCAAIVVPDKRLIRKAAPARRSDASYSNKPTFTLCYVCPPVS